MPRLGWTMEEGTLIEWRKQSGDSVVAGEIIFTVESDKALNEIEAFDSGILHIPDNAPKPDDTVAVGAVLAFLLDPDEDPPTEVPAAETEPERPAAPAEPPAPALQPTRTVPPKPGGPTISPRALRIAAELGVEWQSVEGSGRTGRIVERDIRAAVGTTTTDQSSQTRKLIADRLTRSHQETAPVTLHTEADATSFVALRNKFKSSLSDRGLSVPTYNDLLIKICSISLGEHPILNATWENDQAVASSSIHIGLAVDTETGLLVPVVRDADRLSLQEIAGATAELTENAREGNLQSSELQGGTFTISNLGMYNIDAFTPIINPPQCAILGVGRIVSKPAVVDDRVAAQERITLSLTFDHRIVDGGPAARFLDTIREYIEEPDLWLTR
jgi:pyruvate dehydrogenase E2 component (dihydrolipoamide acetyltransferase)